MNIREQLENLEHQTLSKYASFSDSTKGRDVKEEEDDIRTSYSRDRDRIIHSKSFRRLKHKTQVFLHPEGDHYRTRLTHTLEVSQIARTIAKSLRLNEDLTEAIALGHDLGHTPFGHIGERVLDKLLPNGFEHCDQSVRIVERLEKAGKGLNLTFEVRDGIRNHRTKGNPSTLEGKIVRISDKVAYVNHDVDDAIIANILKETDIPSEIRMTLGMNVRERINNIVTDIIKNSLDTNDIKMSSAFQEATYDLRKWLFNNLYQNTLAQKEEKKAELLIEMLFNHYSKNKNELPEEMLNLIDEGEDFYQVVADYIAGMTDDFAVRRFNLLFIPEGWKY